MEALSLLTGIDLIKEEKSELNNQKRTLDSDLEENVYFNLMSDSEQTKYDWKSIFELI
jgi:hypothetical protein